MKRFLSPLGICVFFLPTCMLSGCSFFYKDPVVLQINSQEWTSRQFAKRLARKIHTLNINDVQNDLLIEKLKEQLITDLLMEYLIYEWAKVHSVLVSEVELQQTLKKIKSSYPSESVFRLYLKRRKTNKKEWETYIKNNLLNKKVIQKIGSKATAPELKEMQEYYQNNLDLFKNKERILIQHVFHKKESLITAVQKSLKQKKNLISAARAFIEDSQITQAQWVERGMLKVFDQAFSLKINQISPVWASSYGYHIIQVLDKKNPQQMKFETVKTQIQQTLLIQRQKALFAKWLDKQSKKIDILKNEKAIKKIKAKVL